MSARSGTDPFLFHSHQICWKIETDNREGDFADYTPADLVGIFSVNGCVQKRRD